MKVNRMNPLFKQFTAIVFSCFFTANTYQLNAFALFTKTQDTVISLTHIALAKKVTLPWSFVQNAKLGRGINMGNALEAPIEGTWGVTIEERFFKLIADKGFNSVRIPINWSTSNLTDISFPYKVSDQLFSRVDWVIENALKNKLSVVICMHHYNELYANPTQHKQRFLAIWDQISKRYKNYTDSLYFELLNEPHDSLDANAWNKLFPEVLSLVRVDSPTRIVIVGPANYNDLYQLNQLVLPNDTNLIVTVHDYLPFQFTHQGADWVTGSDAWLGTTWDNTDGQRKQLQDGFTLVKNYADSHKLPVYVGEFGAYSEGDYYSRCQWTNFMANTMNEFGFTWSYWEFCWVFGLYDRDTNTWREKLSNALLTDPRYPAVKSITGANLLTGDFSSGLTPWILNISGSAKATAKAENNACHISIITPGANSYNIQLTYPGLPLMQGKKYLVSFNASALVNSDITCYTAKNVDPWTNYSDYTRISITPNQQQFSFEFTMTASTDQNARLTFDLGTSLADFYISNVEVREQTFGVAEISVESKDNSTSIANNSNLQMSVVVYPVNALNRNISWSIENITGKAVISSTGLLTAQTSGSVKVVAQSTENPIISGYKQINISSLGTGLKEQKGINEFTYPNPVTGDYLYIQTVSDKLNELVYVSLANITGKVLFTNSFKSGSIKIPIQNFTNGIYMVKIRDNAGVRIFKSIFSRR